MKPLFLGVLLLFIGFGAYAQSGKVSSFRLPDSVKVAFAQKFSNATDVEWKEIKGDYRVSFEIGEVEHEAAFTGTGKLFSHTYDLTHGEVPGPVQSTFKKMFGKAADIDWEKDNENYSVSFEVKQVDYNAKFKPDGKLMKYTFEIPKKALPSAVVSKLNKDFPHYRIDEVYEEKTKRPRTLLYKIKLDGHPDLKVKYNKNGRLMWKVIDR